MTWMFPDGPRQSISMESTGEHPQPPGSQLNANGAPLLPAVPSARAQLVRRPRRGPGLRAQHPRRLGRRGADPGRQAVVNLVPTANTGRDADLDAIAAYVAHGHPRADLAAARHERRRRPADPEIAQGRALFASANCQRLPWRTQLDAQPRRLHTSPLGETITGGQLVRFLDNVGTFDPGRVQRGAEGSARRSWRPMGRSASTSLSLLSVFAGAPYFHSGAAPTLDDVLDNVTHRSAGTGGVDTLTNAADRAKVVKFLKSIDAKTPTFP